MRDAQAEDGRAALRAAARQGEAAAGQLASGLHADGVEAGGAVQPPAEDALDDVLDDAPDEDDALDEVLDVNDVAAVVVLVVGVDAAPPAVPMEHGRGTRIGELARAARSCDGAGKHRGQGSASDEGGRHGV